MPEDALQVAMEVDVHPGEEWRVLSEGGPVTVYALGQPIRGLVLCIDTRFRRECRRLDMQGRELVKVIEPRFSRRALDSNVDCLTEMVERAEVRGRANLGEKNAGNQAIGSLCF